MGKKIKKNTKGTNSKFITRAKAIRKLQIPLKDFRKLCILKGIHPREPKKRLGKTHSTYYHTKDISYLESDKTIDYFRNLSVYKKNLEKAKIKRDTKKIEMLKQQKPQLDINHVVKERYYFFEDALRDLDDSLSMIALFCKFPGHRLFNIDPVKLQISQQLLLMFKAFVVREQLLERVFLSVKGIYYQVRIQGYPIVWVEPYPFTQNLPFDVDYKVILSFMEFYQVFMKFVIFKLYKTNSLIYPPKIEKVEDLDTCTISDNSRYLNCSITKNASEEENQKLIESKELKELQKESQKNNKNLFKGLTFFLSREIIKEIFEFLIKSFGGQVYYDIDNFNSQTFKENDFTHVIVDRQVTGQKKQNTDYVQPQWICDCINNQILLPIQDYIPGQKLPPHLSPFVDSKKEGFIPERLKQIQELKGQYEEESVDVSSEDENVEEEAENYQVKKVTYDHDKEIQLKNIKEEKKKTEDEKLSAMMLTRRKKKLLDRIKNLDEKKKEEIKDLIKRRKQLKKKPINQQ